MNENEEIQDDIVNDDEQYSEESSQSLEAIESFFEEDNEVQAIEETKESIEDEAQPIMVVDDALIQQFPTLSGLKGKPLTEIAKSYDSLTREYTKLKQGKVKETEEVNESYDEDLSDDMPDPYDDPIGFKNWVKGQTENAKKTALDEFNRTLLEKELVKQQEQELEAKSIQYQNEIKSELSKRIPNNITPEEAIDFFVRENKETLLDQNGKLKEDTTKFFIENKDLFINMVAKSVNVAVKSNNYEHDVKNRAFDIAKRGLQRKTTGALGHTEAPRISSEMTEDDLLVQQLYDLAQTND